mmetsp:Transcript_40621/g.63788  ORF Transcript_40621/g.63788 Transcript_40621/m.63788 type:complete len:401 (-) Transcript_40621:129-1331(-)
MKPKSLSPLGLLALILALGIPATLESKRQEKILSLFNVIKFTNTPCTATTTIGGTAMTGTCLTEEECSKRSGGVKSGNCAAGFGVCCVTTMKTCGSTISNNCTYVQNPNYPSAFNGTTCTYSVKQSDTNICQIRLDYLTFSIQGPNLAQTGQARCDIDNWTITGTNNQATGTSTKNNPPVICGLATGQHIYMDVGGSNNANIQLAFSGTGTTADRKWNIKVSQIPCDANYLAPDGCQQYFLGVSGNVKSFNFDVTDENLFTHLPGQDYNICVRQEPGYCGVRWIPTDEPRSFHLSSSATATMSINGQGSCPNDHLDIPGGQNAGETGCVVSGSVTFQRNVDRYCGARLNCIRMSAENHPIFTDRFFVTFVTDAADQTMNNNMVLLNMNRGFSVNYVQTPC